MRWVIRRFGSGVGVMAAVVMVWSVMATASPAAAATALAVTPAFPATVTVGQTASAAISITNVSSAPESSGTVVLSDITLTPTCGAWSPGDCPAAAAVPNALLVSQAAGAAGTACAGVGFAITTVDSATGKLRLDPPAPVVLGATVASATCRIDVTFKVLKRPSTDAMPDQQGVQSVALASATGSASGLAATGTGSAPFTVNRATPTMTTLAGPQPAAVGQAITDTATVTGVDGVPVPTAGIFFRVYADAPGAAPCSGPAEDLGLVGLSPVSSSVASATSPPVVAAAGVGTYRFVAGYIGDVNYQGLPLTACGEAGENVTVGYGTGRYTPLTPARILDTRLGTGGISGPLGPGASVSVPVAGLGGVPASGATAVALNVTVTEPTADGYLTLSPTGQSRPLAANLNFTPDKTVPNLVVVAVGAGGQVDLFNSAGATHVVFDIAGWFSADPNGNAGRFAPLVPARILDTRTGTGTGGSTVRLGPGASLDVAVAGQGGVPVTGVGAVVMNVAVTNASAQSYLTVHPTGEARPLAANLNWPAGATVSNRVIAKLGTSGRVTVYNPAGEVDVVIDVNAWFSDATLAPPGLYTPVAPTRVLDTRTGAGGGGPLPGGAALDVQFTGRAGLPATGVSAVVFNVTAVGPVSGGYLTAYPAGSAPPLAADLNYAAGEIRPNLVVVKLDPAGRASLFTSSTTDLVIDVAGWFS